MWKRILLVTAFVGLIGVLVAGAVIRTMDRTGQVVEARGRGFGRDEGGVSETSGTGSGLSGGDRTEGHGNGSRGPDLGNSLGAQTGRDQAHTEEWVTVEGTVVAVGDDALVVQTDDRAQVAVEGRAWRFAQAEGFRAEPGDEVTLTGCNEGEEFKVNRIDDVASGQSVLLRGEDGRPMWAGRGRYGV